MKISDKYFKQILTEKFESIMQKLDDVDSHLYEITSGEDNKQQLFDCWDKTRKSRIELQDLIDGINKK